MKKQLDKPNYNVHIKCFDCVIDFEATLHHNPGDYDKYIKELNFNIPNTKTFYLLSKDIVNYKINIDIKSNRIKHNIIEVLTSLNLSPTKTDFESINTKIIFATIIELQNDKVTKEQLEEHAVNRLN